MSRIYEFKEQSSDGEEIIAIDLEKVSMVRVERQAGHHFPEKVTRRKRRA